jgi:hypothetical protein
MKKIVLMIFILGTSLFALDVQALLKAHKKSMTAYQNEDKNVSKSIELLREAGIADILGKQPQGISKAQYIHILNDYGFFLYKAKNYEKALSFFRQVLLVDSNRIVTYLNTADNYRKMYESPKGNNSHLLNAIQYYEAYSEKIKPKEVPEEITEFLKKYENMKLVPLKESFLIDELSHLSIDKTGVVFKYSSEDEKQFCQNFVNDVKNKKNIEIIQPKIITNDLFDPEFVKLFPKHSEKLIIALGYRSNTPANNIDQNTGAHTGVLTNFYPKNMKELEEWRDRHNLDSVRQMNIRFYDVDIDNNSSSNGKGKIVFTEGYDFQGQYFILNESLNKILEELSAYKEVGYNIPREYLDEVVKYKNKYYILNLKYNKDTRLYGIRGLEKLREYQNINDSLKSICDFTN